ncbi:DUF2231 domain-containing protein [Rahnella aquatilis]|uniref:Putative membrane protein n=1 Tax=Rahnella aquatilis (strain ATCC 33071 / DSM 4594 / JCM 1683 / NBRC 105701 / NCIMB 13365 / CIP 78.65) TaxID=745277 RepID=H2J233_RAHAC|nr:DUF2231 domain-containing protein [Rahnella aquatilis]AEX54630.1 putative membrane protein [Rahnella aquatilis CIP 78.65 = ATCC 33071]KFD00229.1 putative membrane protein [Rahnella aquatilis CIP 78.65 = ATCC 33071]
MQTHPISPRRGVAVALYELLNPVPLGFFVAAWIFDILYMKTFITMWTDAASWLIVFGLIIAIIPRLINLAQVWTGGKTPAGSPVKTHFWLNLLAVLLAIFNAFIHSRDAYAVVPMGVMLSTLVVVLLLLGNVQLALRARTV